MQQTIPLSGDIDELRRLCRTARRNLRMTQAEAASFIGSTQQWLSNFEGGRTDPPVSMLLKLMALLRMDPLVVLPTRQEPRDMSTVQGDTDEELSL